MIALRTVLPVLPNCALRKEEYCVLESAGSMKGNLFFFSSFFFFFFSSSFFSIFFFFILYYFFFLSSFVFNKNRWEKEMFIGTVRITGACSRTPTVSTCTWKETATLVTELGV